MAILSQIPRLKALTHCWEQRKAVGSVLIRKESSSTRMGSLYARLIIQITDDLAITPTPTNTREIERMEFQGSVVPPSHFRQAARRASNLRQGNDIEHAFY